jgi:outer membrane protein assembly factor BamD
VTRRCILSTILILASVFGCKSAPPTFEEPPPAEELYETGLSQLQGRKLWGILPFVNHNKAIATFQSIVDNYPYSDYAVLAELKIADGYFADRKYEEALSYYRDFSDLHPQHSEVPYTIWRSALCHEKRRKGPNRDQTAVREAVVYLDHLLLNFPYSDYATEGEELWRSLRQQLADHILRIGDFYRKRKEHEAAAERYRMLLNEYPGLGYDEETLYKLGLSYWEMNRKSEAEKIFQSIVQNYADNKYARKAEKRIVKAAN